ncbi:MAG TPA: prepilin-type cleavage/methylation domain-containing protein, partial [Arenimonas sp.]|nr:prepilin-type cleavage/methylation domain-containing protein [Arenimonas sp.]
MNANVSRRGGPRKPFLASGFSLIELMVAMLLGFLVVAAAGAVFLSNKRVYASSETIGRIQENTRVAFELMSRDIREAGGNPCGSASVPVNMLEGANDIFWDRFNEGVTGYDGGDALPVTATGTAAADRVAGTDAIEVHSALGGGVRVVEHDTPSANLQVTSI